MREKGAAAEESSPEQTVCVAPGCNRPHHAKGYCKSHYSQLRRRGGLPKAGKPEGACHVEGCKRPAVANGRCARHLAHPGISRKRAISKAERLKLITQRHDIMKREIAIINKALETED